MRGALADFTGSTPRGTSKVVRRPDRDGVRQLAKIDEFGSAKHGVTHLGPLRDQAEPYYESYIVSG
jgi:hypothetical protein